MVVGSFQMDDDFARLLGNGRKETDRNDDNLLQNDGCMIGLANCNVYSDAVHLEISFGSEEGDFLLLENNAWGKDFPSYVD